jgi:hypothetical protein
MADAIRVDPSTSPPGGLSVSQVPQFVSVTWDDNFGQDGVSWAISLYDTRYNPAGTGSLGTFDGTPIRTSFYYNSLYLDGTSRPVWSRAIAKGHEAADHTVDHPSGTAFNVVQWDSEIVPCRNALADPTTGIGVMASGLIGFRAPFVDYNDNLFMALSAPTSGPAFKYDTTIQGCWGIGESPGNCRWPYTLDTGSPDAVSLERFGRPHINAHPGLWSLMVSALIVPPDSAAAQYGFPAGLRDRVACVDPGFEPFTGRTPPVDITLLVDEKMTKAEALATLKYTLDLHLAGNRSPLIFIAHPHVYRSDYGVNTPGAPNLDDRRAIIAEYLDYALSKPDVRMRPNRDLIAWMQNPVRLGACVSGLRRACRVGYGRLDNGRRRRAGRQSSS